MKIKEAIKEAQNRLSKIDSKIHHGRALLESEILLGEILKKDRIYLHTNWELELEDGEMERFFELVERRESGEPVEYITQRVGFYSMEFFIKNGALIPRSESEILVDISDKIIKENRLKNMVEIGVGSGIISIQIGRAHV